MYTKSTIVSLLLAGPSLIVAQRATDTAVQLPPCITTCYGLAIARANCDTLNPSCICGSNTFFSAVRTCLETGDGTCSQTEAVDVWNKLQAQCADKVSSSFPSLRFTVTEESSVSATMGIITPDPTESGSVTGPGSTSVSATMGTITGPGDTSETAAPTTMGTITGTGEPSVSGTQGSQTSASQSAPTQTPNTATNIIPSIVSLVLGSFVAGGALILMI
ncbi:hypothetical protein H072_11423 [Dactylellina haptotyla CBS 200.50]|uniref:CFEM domain-containing protein n=1 Tax=Dactylellina haptotyla (strain CBS 200.50) TaxID=1284197 RepID=S8BII5_DACHA|nr:hypothetical protein H072_11423 [Dactylellina haptotyla CBS 200.50]